MARHRNDKPIVKKAGRYQIASPLRHIFVSSKQTGWDRNQKEPIAAVLFKCTCSS